MSGALIKYDAMCRAIDAAFEVDEVKDIRDKAVAIEAYAKQAKNTEAERRACEIRLRAERKAGQLSATLEKKQGARNDLTSRQLNGKSETLRKAGISETQARRWEQLAAVSEEQFEAALAAPEKPSTNGIIGKKQEPMNPKALWLWGRLRDFERDGLLGAAPQALLSEMTDAMRADVQRLAPLVALWLKGVNDA